MRLVRALLSLLKTRRISGSNGKTLPNCDVPTDRHVAYGEDSWDYRL